MINVGSKVKFTKYYATKHNVLDCIYEVEEVRKTRSVFPVTKKEVKLVGCDVWYSIDLLYEI